MRRIFGWAGLITMMGLLCLCLAGSAAVGAEPSRVALWKLPEGAIQPQAAVDSRGVVHLLYYKTGVSEGAGNLYYMRMASGQTRASDPLRVNSQEDTAGAIGTVRTAQLAIGKDDRVHVVWNGLGPKASNGYPTAYQAYTRLNEAGTAFEPQRNLITWAKGVDGGGSVAADNEGDVYVTWHALANAKDETGRAVFVTHSSDNGATFTRERQANPDPTGACGCCGMRAFVDRQGVLYVLYRAAINKVDRDTMLLVSRDRGRTFTERRLHRWNIDACPMSTYSLTESADGILAAWETGGRVYYGTINPVDLTLSGPLQAAGDNQKHPFVAAASNGQTLLIWAEGTGWQRGGSLAWQVMDKNGVPILRGKKADAIPVWGLATGYARPDSSFVIVY